MKRSVLKWLVTSAVIGLVISVGLLVAEKFVSEDRSYSLHRVMRVTWPSSIFMMATEGIENTAKGYVFVIISVGVNVLLYGALGALVWWLKYLISLAIKSGR